MPEMPNRLPIRRMPIHGCPNGTPQAHTVSMGNDFDLTDGGRRRIVDEDQAANLREIAEKHAEFELFFATLGHVCTARWDETIERIEHDAAVWDELGEGNQDPEIEEPA